MSAIGGIVGPVTFRTTVTPDFTWDPSRPAPPPTPGLSPAGWLLPILKPTVVTQFGIIAPYGDAADSPNYFLGALVGGAVVVFGVLGLAAWIGRATKR